jgi:hypothetical protein
MEITKPVTAEAFKYLLDPEVEKLTIKGTGPGSGEVETGSIETADIIPPSRTSRVPADDV